MMNIIGVGLFLLIAFGVFRIGGHIKEAPKWIFRAGGLAAIAVAGMIGFNGLLAYNDAGYCTHVQTAWGQETSKCDLGWYVRGYGNTTIYPHYITVAHTDDPNAEGSSLAGPYSIRMADNWNGLITQTTRFGIPQDPEQFISMHREFRSVGRMITSTLVPSVTAALDSTASLYTMEEYWGGGARDAFKRDFSDALIKGRPVTKRGEVIVHSASSNPDTAPSDSPVSADTARTGDDERVRVVTERLLDENGFELRTPNDFARFGVTVSSAIVTNLDPDDTFEVQIQKRKDAAARRSVAVEERLEEEERRLLEIAKGERTIATRQAEARTEQIEATTQAETKKRLALIEAERVREEAEIARQTAEIQLDRARIDAEAVVVTADAAAYEREALLAADNALQIKLDTEVAIQEVWAQAYATRRVPQIVFAGSEGGDDIPVGGDSEVSRFLDLLTVDAAKRLAYDRSIGAEIDAPAPTIE